MNNEIKYYRLTMDYKEYNFEKFKKELEKENSIKWFFPYKETTIKDNDIVFIYCSNMPDLVNRYIMKAHVKKVIYKKDNKELFKKEYFSNTKEYEKYNVGIILDNIKAFKYDDIYLFSTNKFQGNNNEPIEGCGGFRGPYGEIIKNKTPKIDELINYSKFMKIETLLDTFVDGTCFFKDKIICYPHKTFPKNNGVMYIEYHHFIFRSKGIEDQLTEKINQTYNYFRLCPTCHRRIHYGNNNDKKEMIDIILKNCNAVKLEEIVKKIDNNKNLKEYIYDIYNIN